MNTILIIMIVLCFSSYFFTAFIAWRINDKVENIFRIVTIVLIIGTFVYMFVIPIVTIFYYLINI